MESQNEQTPTFMEKFRFLASLYSLTLFPHDPKTRPHWNEIVPGLILGGLPIESTFMGHGNHGEKLINQCKQKGRPLSLVVSAIEKWELEGKGIGIKPVTRDFWQKNGVERHHLNMQDFTGDADLGQIKKEVDAIHQARNEDKSAYVHCKAGRGRSYLVVFCYLMMHEGMDANQALEAIYKQRSQVSPSGRQFATIEAFRQEYCPDVKALNIDSDSFYPYRKDILSFGHSSKLHGLLTTSTSYLLGSLSFGYAALAGIGIKKGVEYAQNWHSDYQNNQYLSMLTKSEQTLKLEQSQIESFNSGYLSSSSWKNWAKSWVNSATYLNGYAEFASGYKAGKEHNEALHEKVNRKQEASIRVNPPRACKKSN